MGIQVDQHVWLFTGRVNGDQGLWECPCGATAWATATEGPPDGGCKPRVKDEPPVTKGPGVISIDQQPDGTVVTMTPELDGRYTLKSMHPVRGAEAITLSAAQLEACYRGIRLLHSFDRLKGPKGGK